ncbi:MAG TPA: hypothetical protein VKR79_09335 [Gaiellaceae bacterium]|nr:hypothetical protein [Gaiellaceae bacterium]
MKKALILVFAALLIPGAALAAKPAHPTHPTHPTHGSGAGGSKSKSAPNVLYVLKGTLSGYTAYDSSTSTNGSITIVVSRANYHGKTLKGQTLTFPVDSKTKVSLENGLTTITDGDKGIVKVRAAKKIPAADLATTLQASSAKQIVDQGTSG